MKKLRFKSLTFQIWSYFVAMMITIVIIFLVINFFMFRNIERETTYKNLQVYQELVLNSDFRNDPHRMEEYLKRYRNLKDMDYFFVKGNQIIVSNKFDRDEPPQMESWMASYVKKMKTDSERFSGTYDNQGINFLIKKVDLNGQKSYLVTYSYSMGPKQDFTQLIYISLMLLFLGLIVSKLISNNLSKPLKKLELYTERIAGKEWTEPLEVDRQDEIGRLMKSMNQMQKALKNAEEEERAFLQSISHDLKTPVMVIKSYAEAIQDGVYIDNLEETAKIISNESTKLERKIKQLIYYNSLNYLISNEKKTDKVRLDELFQELYDRFKLMRNDIKWEFELDEALLLCSHDRLSVAFENIIDNQLRYAESQISIKLKKVAGEIEIKIYNDGPNIKEEALNQIFDRFYKEKKGNFGLGLAITQKIIEAYNGTIQVVNHPKGVSFIVKFKAE